MHNILHITNEITKKNFSISSLISHITTNGNNSKTLESKVLCSDIDNSNIVDQKNLTVRKIKWLNFLKFKNIFSELFIKFDVIHVHGIWAPIQIYSIIFCIINSKALTIHSHGMLLLPAINDGGFLKKFFKKIFLLTLRILISNVRDLRFVAITIEEFKTIQNLFPHAKIKLIPNNIPFKNFFSNNKNLKYKKNFVFFGRIHPHKNILKLINLFKKSGLMKNGWSLEIYGIEDDKNYLKKINQNIIDFPRIRLLKPVFGLKKANIIKGAWANILVSKSEVLSFSVMESGLYGLTSIVSDNIETLEGDNVTNKVKDSPEEIIKKIVEVASWSNLHRKLIGQKTSKFFNGYKKISEKLFLKKLNSLYISLIYKKINTTNVSLESFYITSLVHSLNVFLPNIILFLSFIAFDSKVAAEIGITNITFITLTQMLSGNIRLISIKEKNTSLLRNNLFFRLVFGVIILCIFQGISYNLSFIDEHNTTFLIATLIILLWCSELALSIFEIQRNIIKLIFALFFYVLLIISLIVTFLLQDLFFIHLIISLCIGGLLIFCLKSINFNFNLYKNFKNLLGKTTGFEQYLSSISSPLSSLCWRFYLFFSYTKEISGTIFIAFAICSFPGTFFNSVLGPNFFYNRMSINSKFKLYFIILLSILIIYNLTSIQKFDLMNFNENDLFFHVLKISSIGSLIMTYAMYCRQNDFFKKKANSINIFYKDIFYGISLVLILPCLDVLGGVNYIVYSYSVGAAIAVIVFSDRIKLGKIRNIKKYVTSI